MSNDFHTETILQIRRELAEIDGALQPLQERRCELRSRLLSEIEAMQAEYLYPAASVDPGAELRAARGNAGVEDA